MSTPQSNLLTIVEMAKELNLSESRVRAILGKEGSPAPIKYGEWYGGGRTANKYDFEEFKSFYRESLIKKGKDEQKVKAKVSFNNRASSFIRGVR